MRRVILSILVCFIFLDAHADNFHYLENRIPQSNMRYSTFLYGLDLMSANNVQTIVETGTARYGDENYLWDGGSTIIFADWAKANNAVLYSIDIDVGALRAAKKATEDYKNHVNLVHSDSVEFLKNFHRTIDFLYLDSFDFDYNNPLPSQMHHLKEIEAAYPVLGENCFVMIDDCDLPYGGKGKLVIEYLEQRGWKILQQGYQVILSR